MVIIVNVAGVAVGAVVLIMTISKLISPSIAPDTLLMKHPIYFLGRVFINASIYSAITAVYEILPKYANYPWTVSKPFPASWFAATFTVMAVYPHHLPMDFAMPSWAAMIGQIISYTSGIRWHASSSLLVLGSAVCITTNGDQDKSNKRPVCIYAAGGITLYLSFLVSGSQSIPRRFVVGH